VDAEYANSSCITLLVLVVGSNMVGVVLSMVLVGIVVVVMGSELFMTVEYVLWFVEFP